MSEILPLTWYFESPIDFEHKQYVLLGYLMKVDKSFLDKQLSPYLLHLEKIIKELEDFEKSFDIMEKKIDKNKYIFFQDDIEISHEIELINEIKDIVDFSIPQIQIRIELGYKILNRNKQVLY
jgi:hypothetical protein